LVPTIFPILRDIQWDRYIEPFVGGGAIFFAVAPKVAVLADINPGLINAYRQVRDRCSEVVRILKRMPVSQEVYTRVRARTRVSGSRAAAEFLYINRTSFGGIHRVNRSGIMNVPFGGGQRTPRMLWHGDLLKRASSVLRGAELCVGDFESVVRHAGAGDVIFCDPTYALPDRRNGFDRYDSRIFVWDDQRRLYAAVLEAVRRGASAIISNVDDPRVRALYRKESIVRVKRFSGISRESRARGVVRELLIIIRAEKRVFGAQRMVRESDVSTRRNVSQATGPG